MSSLTLISLPIGNFKDITLRAIEALKEGQYFFAEDTRVFKKILESLNIGWEGKFIDSFHDHSQGKIERIVEKVKEGTTIYLVSDAGSPMISDPAYPLIKRMLEENLAVKTVPGVTSVITALELSCLPPHPFHFWGFLGRSKSEQLEFFRKLSSIEGTHIFFESPHRIFDSIESFFEINSEGELVITRELTKLYESVYRIKKDDLMKIKEIVMDKGEFVVLFNIKNSKHAPMQNEDLKAMVVDYLESKGTPKKLAKIFSKMTGVDAKVIYDQLSRSNKE